MASLAKLIHSVKRGFKYRIMPLIGAVLYGREKKSILQDLEKHSGISLPFVTQRGSIVPTIEYDIQLSANKTIEALIIQQGGRLGNELIQLINGLYIARKIGLHTIYLDWNPSFMNEGVYIVDGITIRCDRKESTKQCCLISTFFYLEEEHLKEPIPLNEYTHINQLIYTVLLKKEIKEDRFPLDDSDLVIHVRSGDIFKKKKPHKLYAQPPLAYYLKVLEIAKPKRVILVYEDTGNPCIEALQKYMSDKNILYINFSRDLVTTVSLLLHAKNICYGIGSFVPQIIFLCEDIKKNGYTYNNTSSRIQRKFEKMYCIEEENKEYREKVLKKWRNTDNQRKKMIQYTRGDFSTTMIKEDS